MRFSLDIPDAAAMKVGKEDYHLLEAGTELHRIHLDSFGSAEFNGTDKGSARFSPIRNAGGLIIPTIYAGESFECAVCEIILRCPHSPPRVGTSAASREIVYPADHRHRVHSRVETAHDLNLVSVTATGQRKIGINGNGLLGGPKSTYPITRSWAERIHAYCPTAQGLYYNSYQYGPEFALVLFGDRVPPDILNRRSDRRVTDAACHAEIVKLADSLSIDYIDV